MRPVLVWVLLALTPAIALGLPMDPGSTGDTSGGSTGIGTSGLIEPGTFGDFDLDGDVDLKDLRAFRNCFSGSSVHYPSPNCAAMDADHDQDVDIFDFMVFQASFTGSGGSSQGGTDSGHAPEPLSIALSAMALGGLAWRRARARRTRAQAA